MDVLFHLNLLHCIDDKVVNTILILLVYEINLLWTLSFWFTKIELHPVYYWLDSPSQLPTSYYIPSLLWKLFFPAMLLDPWYEQYWHWCPLIEWDFALTLLPVQVLYLLCGSLLRHTDPTKILLDTSRAPTSSWNRYVKHQILDESVIHEPRRSSRCLKA